MIDELIYPCHDKLMENNELKVKIIKVAVSSDNHLDVNQVDPKEALQIQSQYLRQHRVDYYLYAGDLFNNFQQSQDYFAQLQKLLPEIHVYYIMGNHDMLNQASWDQIEHPTSPLYIHNRFIDVPDTNWRIIGNNGWYDYSFSQYKDQPQAVANWKKVYWLDSMIDQPMSDQERMQLVLQEVQTQLHQAKVDHKQILFLTHFAPRHELLAPKPQTVNSQRAERFYQMINAMMGSDRLGQLLESAANVHYVFYGHLHGIHAPLTHDQLTYFNQAVGVRRKRHSEWQYPTFREQWINRLRILAIN